MKYLNFSKLLPQRDQRLEELKKRADLGAAVEKMKDTEGWKVIEKLYHEQLEVYKADLLLGVENWEQYQEKRSKAWAMNLLLTDIEDYIRQGKEAEDEIDRLNAS